MKRPRSYEDLDEDGGCGEKAGVKDRDGSSSHRRFHRDRGSPRSFRKQFEHDADVSDRWRFRDGKAEGRSSPRGSGDRMHRSESFSALRREFPKGFRSERERSRRESSGGSSWRRPGGGGGREREAPVDKLRSPSASSDLVAAGGRGSHVAAEEDPGKVMSRDSPSGEQLRGAETWKVVDGGGSKESCSSSEMEEGELEPDPEPQPLAATSSPTTTTPMKSEMAKLELADCNIGVIEDGNVAEEANSKKEEVLSPVKKCWFYDGRKEERSPEMKVDQVLQTDKSSDARDSPVAVQELNEEDEYGVGGSVGRNELEIEQEESSNFAPGIRKPSEQAKEHGATEERNGIVLSSSTLLLVELKNSQGEECNAQAEVETGKREETGIKLEVEHNERRGFDLEVEPDSNGEFPSLCKEVVADSTPNEDELKLVTEQLKENHRDKGKSLAISISDEAGSMEDDNPMEGTSGRGFELVFHSEDSDATPGVQAPCTAIVMGKHKDENPKLELLNLSLGLPGALLDQTTKLPDPTHTSSGHARSVQSLPSSLHTFSDGFTTSFSFSGSQPFGHNPSCSLTQYSTENYEHSVGSRPMFHGVDQTSNSTIWQAQASNESRRKGGGGTLFQRALLNGDPTHNSLIALNGQHLIKPDVLTRQLSLPRQQSPANSHGSHDTRSENSKDKGLLIRVGSNGSLFRKEQRDGDRLILNGVGFVERIISKIVSEPLQVTSRMLEEMSEHSLVHLRQSIHEMVVNGDRQGQVHALREVLQGRSDLNMETMTKCPQSLLEILVALKTGVADFLQRTDNILHSDLVDIFLNLKCRNPACRSNLPVDDCDCRICVQKNGFCRECMCLVCSKFDMASNTCSWVGCDVCLHWCHTDCGLQKSHIRNGSASGIQGMTEIQFHCIACDHPSDMFGFVKEVFKTCAKGWKIETLAKELQYVRRIFAASKDAVGKKLYDVANQMLMRLEDNANLSEVINYIMALFIDSEPKINSSLHTVPSKEPARTNIEGSNMRACSSKETAWLPSFSLDKVTQRENIGAFSNMGYGRINKQTRASDLHINMEKKPAVDELESVVRLKQAEAKMYQERADDARREAEGLKRIAVAKNVKIEEEYATRIAKLRLVETEDMRRQKLDELQNIKKAHDEYFNMKMRMQADIRDLLLKMEAAKRNFST